MIMRASQSKYEGEISMVSPDFETKTNPDGVHSYTYDAIGNLTAVTLPDGTQIEYVIDGLNRRVGKKVNGALVKGWLYANQINPIAELDENGNITSQFIYATKPNVPDYMISGGVEYRIITDQVGSPRLIVNSQTGAIAQRIDYDEFGNITSDTNPGFQPFAFAGGLYDAQTKLVRFGARDYDPETGRWTAKDPIRFDGGDANLYGYVMADPVNLTDPSGLTLRSNTNFLLDWLIGGGSSNRFYGADTIEAQEMRQSPAAEKMRRALVGSGCVGASFK